MDRVNTGDEATHDAAPEGLAVQQHVLRAVNRAGAEIAVPACLVVAVSGGLITRLDEYLDSRHVDLITGAG